jgi:hypothetical protein
MTEVGGRFDDRIGLEGRFPTPLWKGTMRWPTELATFSLLMPGPRGAARCVRLVRQSEESEC